MILIYILMKPVWLGLGFAIFSSLLLFNFINISINNKRKEIGILCSLGSNRKDVFSIFLTENLCITLMSVVLTILGCIIFCVLINKYLKSEFQILITVFIFGIKQVFLIFLIGVLTAFISTFIPIYKIASKKPIDIIKQH